MNLLIRINCRDCKNHCCGEIKNLRPVLLPSEEKKFREYSNIIKNPIRNLLTIKRKDNGNCIFFDDKTKKCVVEKNKPFECELYPFLLDFSGKEIKIKLDKRCPNLKTLKYDKKKINSFIKNLNLPENYIKAYNKYTKQY